MKSKRGAPKPFEKGGRIYSTVLLGKKKQG